MEGLTSLLAQLPGYFIFLFRIIGVIFSAPVFSSRSVPVPVRIFFSLLLSTMVFLVLAPSEEYNLDLGFIFLLISEFLVGIVIGFVANLLFSAIQLAGQSIDMQMCFGIVNVMDPQTGLQVPLMGTFQNLLAILVYLSINGHHQLIEALFLSYKIVPVNGLIIKGALIEFLIQVTANMFVIALKLAAPLVGALFITDFVMGIIARTVPQMNVFLVGMPAKILIGFLLMFLILPFYIYLLNALFEGSLQDIFRGLRVLA
ncbi:MAG: flagellar type III secretion system protein FliR [Clostridia bacterium]|nr:flagellar type III secretion system protein FliR [Clostridia bacterium]